MSASRIYEDDLISTSDGDVLYNGARYIYKKGNIPFTINNFIAYKMYEAADVNVPTSFLVYRVTDDSIAGILLSYSDGRTATIFFRRLFTPDVIHNYKIVQNSIEKDLVIHALFSNMDAAKPDNYFIFKISDGYDYYNPCVIDVGGSLFYNADGTLKETRQFSPFHVHEIKEIPLYSSLQSVKFYERLTDEAIRRTSVCDRWSTINKTKIVEVLDTYSDILRLLPRGDNLRKILTERMIQIDEYCGLVSLSPNQIALKKDGIRTELLEDVIRPLLFRGIRKPVAVRNIERVNLEGRILHGTETSLLPTTPVGISLNRSAESDRIRHSLFMRHVDPAIDRWLLAQTDYIAGLSQRDFGILKSYTRVGDELVNNYCRGTLTGDISDLFSRAAKYDQNPLAYSFYDQFQTYSKRGLISMPRRKEDLLSKDSLNLPLIYDIFQNNLGFFGNASNTWPLVEQYKQELVRIISAAPKQPHAFTVFRGFKSESYLRSLSFTNVDFLSTSISPETAVTYFTKRVNNISETVPTKYYCCVYELEVKRNVPCIYMQSISDFPNEFEILIIPGMKSELGKDIFIKKYIPTAKTLNDVLAPSDEFVSVVEGIVHRPSTISYSRGESFEGPVYRPFIKVSTKYRYTLREKEKEKEKEEKENNISNKKEIRTKIQNWKTLRRKRSELKGKLSTLYENINNLRETELF